MTGGLLIDTNLLCLLIVGMTDREQIGRHRRVRSYDPADFDLVASVVDRAPSMIVCPHVLAETSNLLRYTNDAFAVHLHATLAGLAVRCIESYEPASGVITDEAFHRLGLTDAVLLSLAKRDHLLLSDDRGLCYAAAARALRVVNFNYLRDGAVRLDQLFA